LAGLKNIYEAALATLGSQFLFHGSKEAAVENVELSIINIE